MDIVFLKAAIEAWGINAKREKEANLEDKLGGTYDHWEGQEIAFKRVIQLIEKAGVQ